MGTNSRYWELTTVGMPSTSSLKPCTEVVPPALTLPVWFCVCSLVFSVRPPPTPQTSQRPALCHMASHPRWSLYSYQVRLLTTSWCPLHRAEHTSLWSFSVVSIKVQSVWWQELGLSDLCIPSNQLGVLTETINGYSNFAQAIIKVTRKSEGL